MSLTPGVTFRDNHNPSLWRNLWLFHPSKLMPAPRERIRQACSKGFKLDQKIVGTHYFYWYRWPDSHFWDNADWTDDALQDHFPPERTKHVSFDSARWHEMELRDIIDAGIDFIVPVYWGTPDNYLKSGTAFSVLGMAPMVEAMDRIAADGKTTPKVGLFYDSSTLLTGVRGLGEPGRVLDLTTDHGKDVFYRTIRDFFCMVPPRHWATLDGKPIVVLYGTFGAKHDASTLKHTNRRFEEEFGCRPYVIRNAGWNLPTDAITSWGAALAGPMTPGPTKPGAVVQIGPGYDDRAVPGRTTPQRNRDDGGFYQASWRTAIRSGRNVVLLETWNEMHEGTDICASREYGREYIDLTATYSRVFKQGLPLPPFTYEPSDIETRRKDRGKEFADAELVTYRPGESGGLDHVAGLEDGRSEIVEVGGIRALRTEANEVSAQRYLYFDVADPYAFNVKGDVEVTVEFLDEGKGAFTIDYDSRDADATLLGAYRSAPGAAFSDTGKWKTVTRRLTGARLANRQNGGADLRLQVGGRDLTVRKVVVRKLR